MLGGEFSNVREWSVGLPALGNSTVVWEDLSEDRIRMFGIEPCIQHSDIRYGLLIRVHGVCDSV